MKTSVREELEKAKEVLAELERHPLTAQIRADEAAATLEKRKAAAAAIQALEVERAEALPKLQVEIDGMIERLACMDRERADLLAAVNGKRLALGVAKAGIEGGIMQQQEILFATYAPQIDAGIQFFRDKLDWLRSEGRISRIASGAERNIFTETTIVRSESNMTAVHNAMAVCMSAIKALEQMKLQPELDLSRIEALKAGIPRIDVYEEEGGEKPFPRLNLDARSLLPSDSEMTWSLGKLHERIKKVMGRS